MSQKKITDLQFTQPQRDSSLVKASVNWANTTAYANYWRCGPEMMGRGIVVCTGSPAGSGTLTFTLPDGHKVARYALPLDPTALAAGVYAPTNGTHICGSCEVHDVSTVDRWTGTVQVAGASTLFFKVVYLTGAGAVQTAILNSDTIPTTFANTDTISFMWRVPIDGWA